jgi:DNA-binding CsgD family transcriptional regulator
MKNHRFVEIGLASDKDVFKKLLLNFAHDMDFELMSAHIVVKKLHAKPQIRAITNTPAAFVAASQDNEDAKRDPVLQQLNRSSTPLIYSQSTYVDAGAIDLWDQQAPFGYRNGIAVALHLPDAKHFVLGFDRAATLTTNDLKLTRLRADIQLLAVHAQEAAFRLLATEPEDVVAPILTDRQFSVLQWIAQGKSVWEISRILGCSEDTVKFHAKNLYQKLHVQNKQEAIMSGIGFGFIRN